MRITPFLSLALVSCNSTGPARVVVDSGTLIINGPLPVQVHARVLGGDGRPYWHPDLIYSHDGDAAEVSSGGRVTCVHAGNDEVIVSHDGINARVSVQCRPIEAFRPPPEVELVVGGLPKRVVVEPMGWDGRPVTLLNGTATVRDRGVAYLRDGRVYPLALGRTKIDFDFDGVATAVGVEVDERVVEAALDMMPGELRTWHLPPGYYDVRLDTPGAEAQRTALALGAYRSNCSQAISGGEHYYCIAKDHASIVVRVLRTDHEKGDVTGTLRILRKP